MPPKAKLILTADGSHTLQVPELDETYHSVHGAIQESQHVYIEAGLNYWLQQNQSAIKLHLLEVGFGTGLNALLTALAMPDGKVAVYHSLEKYPLSETITNTLNYGSELSSKTLFNKIHQAAWDTEQAITPELQLTKITDDLLTFTTSQCYDVLYFDAFAPDKQPELWTRQVFEKCFDMLKAGGVLVTYSAKGQVKRDLRAAGFTVESLPGPPGKFEITRAIKS